MTTFCKWAAFFGAVISQVGGLLMLVTLRIDHSQAEILGRMCGGMLGLTAGSAVLFGRWAVSARMTLVAALPELQSAAAVGPNTNGRLLARLVFSIVAGAGLGAGACFLSLGLLPEFPAIGPPSVPERFIQGEDYSALLPPYGDEPIVRAEKRRFATVMGIGFLTGVVGAVLLFRATRRWVEPVSTMHVESRIPIANSRNN